jgi:hypothetical protein
MESMPHPLSFKLLDPFKRIFISTAAETLNSIERCEHLMGEASDAMQSSASMVCQSEKYRIMLKRNYSIVKDTISKLWKLSSIIVNHINNHGTAGS